MLDAFFYAYRGNDARHTTFPVFAKLTADPNEGLKYINQWFDRIADAASIENDADRMLKFDELVGELKTLDEKVRDTSTFSSMLNGRKDRGKALGEIMVAFMTPAFQQVGQS